VSRPRVLFVGSTTYELPLASSLAKKWNAVSNELDIRVVARGRDSESEDARFRLIRPRVPGLEGVSFFGSLPLVVGEEVRRFRPDVLIAASPYEGFASLLALPVVRPRPKLVVELHGDWRTAARLYGSPLRRVYAPLADRTALRALRRADATRAVSDFTASLALEVTGRTPLAVFPAYFDIESFSQPPLRPVPREPAVAWIGTLQRSKNPAAVARAWRLVAVQMPNARLGMVGWGPLQPLVGDLVRDFPGRVTAIAELSPPEVARLLDRSTLLVLSSVSEGLGRVIIEAFSRGRPVVAFAVGGIPDLVEDERNGLLVTPGDHHELATALVRVLSDHDLAERLGHQALLDAEQLRWTPERYAAALRELVEHVLA
jgi:glycosyltransferase involved in cell wall biosynthesis